MAEAPEARKPDLKNGFPIRDFGERNVISGQIDGEEIVLARRGHEFFAVGTHCTHYGGPLANGLIAGDTLRCPWHRHVSLCGLANPYGHRLLILFLVGELKKLATKSLFVRKSHDPLPSQWLADRRTKLRCDCRRGGAAG